MLLQLALLNPSNAYTYLHSAVLNVHKSIVSSFFFCCFFNNTFPCLLDWKNVMLAFMINVWNKAHSAPQKPKVKRKEVQTDSSNGANLPRSMFPVITVKSIPSNTILVWLSLLWHRNLIWQVCFGTFQIKLYRKAEMIPKLCKMPHIASCFQEFKGSIPEDFVEVKLVLERFGAVKCMGMAMLS